MNAAERYKITDETGSGFPMGIIIPLEVRRRKFFIVGQMFPQTAAEGGCGGRECMGGTEDGYWYDYLVQLS